MDEFFSSGAAVDVVLAVIAVEYVALLLLDKSGRRRATAIDLAFALAPGACILLALRASLTGAGWTMIALWLAISFPIHVGDLVRRRAQP